MGQEHLLSDNDIRIAALILRKALESRPQIKEAVFGTDLGALSREEQIKKASNPTVGVYHDESIPDIPQLHLLLVSDMLPVLDVMFTPYEAIHAFLSHARDSVLEISPPESSAEEKEKVAFDRAVLMTLIMIDSVHRRVELMMDSFTTEVAVIGHVLRRKELQVFRAARGEPLPLKRDKPLEEVLRKHTKSLKSFWDGQVEVYQRWQQSFRFAEAYEVIHPHWRTLSGLSSKREDWRHYAKVSNFEDTPDDLLDRLQNNIDRLDSEAAIARLSELALEHAGRRVGLINTLRLTDAALKQRKKGIKVTGYTSAQLFNILKKGRNILESIKGDNSNSAQKKSGN